MNSILTLFLLPQILKPNNICTKYYEVQKGDTCASVMRLHGITTSNEFLILNPGFDCSRLMQANSRICVSREPTCKAAINIKKGDTCQSIATSYSFTVDRLREINPNVNCNRGLPVGALLCVLDYFNARDNSIKILNRECTKYVFLETGESACSIVAQKYSLSLEQFIQLNARLKCNEPLKVGLYVCVSDAPQKTEIRTNMVTKEQFNRAVTSSGYPQPAESKYNNFIRALAKEITTKRELAMFLAHALHESDGLVRLIEIPCAQTGCPNRYKTANDYPYQRYYGRGYIKLTWSFNYKTASQDLYKDSRLYTNPNQVATSDNIAWDVSFWIWKKLVHSHPGVAIGKFGVTTNALNGALECKGAQNRDKARRRFELYKRVLIAFGINETPNETGCYN